MKGMINEEGVLSIKRGDKMRVQCCIYNERVCSDRCPKFGDPYKRAFHPDSEVIWYVLPICKDDVIEFTQGGFEDKRIPV